MLILKLKKMPLFEIRQLFNYYLELSDYGKMLMIRDEVYYRYKNKLIVKDDLVEYEQVMFNKQTNSKGKVFDFSKDSVKRYLNTIDKVKIKYRRSDKQRKMDSILSDIRERSSILDRREIFSNFSY